LVLVVREAGLARELLGQILFLELSLQQAAVAAVLPMCLQHLHQAVQAAGVLHLMVLVLRARRVKEMRAVQQPQTATVAVEELGP
jgi:outer membrane biosynthesis protein TonB